MQKYRVIWKIDLENETALGAALEALEIQRDPDSIATVFNVVPEDSDMQIIDLEED